MGRGFAFCINEKQMGPCIGGGICEDGIVVELNTPFLNNWGEFLSGAESPNVTLRDLEERMLMKAAGR